MKSWLIRLASVLGVATLMVVFAFAVHVAYMEFFAKEQQAVALPAIAVNPTAPLSLRDAENAIVDASAAVMPAVISVQTKERVSISGFRHPFADDPFFRHFFGERFDGHGSPPREGVNQGLGSGVIVDSSGVALTNYHVVKDADEIIVKLGNGREFPALVLGTDQRLDIAVIRIQGDGPFPVARLGNSDGLKVGMIVLAMGTPFSPNLSQTVTMGIVSALSRSGLGIEAQENFIQTDAAINRGNSGGPLVNLNGEIIGINVAIITGGAGNDGVGLAIPANSARYSLESILTNGRVVRGYLGVAIQNLDDELRQSVGLPSTHGALVSEVVEGGPAERAGLKVGDVVTQWNGVEIRSAASLTDAVARTPVGITVPIVYFRNSQYTTVSVKVAERPTSADTEVKPEESSEQPRTPSTIEKLGITVRWVDGDGARRFNLPARGAVVITEVAAGSTGAERGLAPGTGILEVDGRKITSIAVLEDALKGDGRHLLLIRAGGSNRFITVN